ncbi:putative disease resistance protein RGA3 [Macadamia integrifolia]|uniref:putative disease resistance protein RGA3 n=1 Tax=Macadamia integrifolia TaxID=60698 RepID=UPI001C4ED5DC|nr:putative disease resistance protein RGA3 [Macadamia integrifolia]
MAEALLSGLAPKILKDLGSLLIQEIGTVLGLEKELSKLKASLSTIDAILSDAEKKGATNEVVKDWLRKLKDVAYDTEDVLDAIATEALRQKLELPSNIVLKQVCRSFSPSNPLVFRLKMAHKIKDIIERLDHIQKDSVVAQFQFTTHHQSVDMDINDRRHTDHFVIESEVMGREEDKEKLVKLLTSGGGNNEDNNVMVIPIIGIGGLGKTTLAQLVYNDESVIKKYFDVRMWVCVSFDFNVVHLAKKILESLTSDNCSGLGEIQAKSQLVEKLSGKRYLLVLDDIWNEKNPGKWEDLRKLLIGGASGSVILVTTRSEVVASIMQPIKYMYKLEGLNENDCQSLFNQRAFGRKEEEANHPELVKIGKGIVKKCGGVPLAAKALGSLLRLKRNKKDWLNILDTKIWNLEEQEILPALRISYNHLPSHLKQCFAYCTMFPEDHEIEVDDLIHQWMAHGFILQPPPPTRGGGSHSTMSLEDIGYGYFRDLLWRSFFQEVTEDDKLGKIMKCKMHDLVHSLARWVAGMEWSKVTVDCPSSRIISIPKGVRHMELSKNLNVVPVVTDDKTQKLRTLYLPPNFCISRKQNDLFSPLRGLRVLQLSIVFVVPTSLGYLEQLRYLDLSHNHFKALPNSICRLYNLQTLRLEGCIVFKEWPRDITKMVSLRHLQLDETCHSMQYMPRGLGQLSSLQTLSYFIVGDERRRRSGGLGELHGLNQLRGELFIRELGNVKYVRDAKEANLKDKSELQSLILDWGYPGDNRRRRSSVEEQVLENLQPHQNLKALSIEYYEGIKMPRVSIY